MSISSVQRRRLLAEVARAFYSTGEKPRLADIVEEISRWASVHPFGQPLKPMEGFAYDGITSDVDKFNSAMAHMVYNLEVAYETTMQLAQDNMMLGSVLEENLERLKARRQGLMAKMDDYLFSVFNSDGYYYSFSDKFNDTGNTDLILTSALVDPNGGYVMLPSDSDLTKRILPEDVVDVTISVLDNGRKTSNWKSTASFDGCLDGLSNTLWAIEVEADKESEIVVSLSVTLGNTARSVDLSRIEFDPYSITPMQGWVTTSSDLSNISYDNPPFENYNTNWDKSVIRSGVNFGGDIQTMDYRTVWTDNIRRVKTVNFVLRKTEADFVSRETGRATFHYIFGAKDIIFLESVYDNEAVWVSQPLSLPSELESDNVIDAVALVVEESIPTDTAIQYYVAMDTGTENPELSDFTWTEISPMDDERPKANTVVKFDGANKITRFIRSDPSESELQLIPQARVAGTGDLDLNPAYMFDSVPVELYRIAELNDSFVPASMIMEEGVNTTRILYNPIEYTPGTGAIEGESLAYWKDFVDGTSTNVNETYGRIDNSRRFFDGRDVAEDFTSVYVETNLEAIDDLELLFKSCKKTDENSRAWAVKVFLNGVQVADMPVGENEAVIPWKFNKGINQIILLITIPEANNATPYITQGQIDLMAPNNLFDYGAVKLGTWTYADPFAIQYNEQGSPMTFTVYERNIAGGAKRKEIVSRRAPKDNLRLKYTRPSGTSPSAVRLRADLSRKASNPNVSPKLDLYRLRFLYG